MCRNRLTHYQKRLKLDTAMPVLRLSLQRQYFKAMAAGNARNGL